LEGKTDQKTVYRRQEIKNSPPPGSPKSRHKSKSLFAASYSTIGTTLSPRKSVVRQDMAKYRW
jgi:hypothetical protein